MSYVYVKNCRLDPSKLHKLWSVRQQNNISENVCLTCVVWVYIPKNLKNVYCLSVLSTRNENNGVFQEIC